jgi:predicted LPLAT superfamily acyltransferase
MTARSQAARCMNPKAADIEGSKAAEWVAHRERGSLWLLKIMAFLSLRCGRGASRIILYGIALYFFLFGPSARRHSLHYLRLALKRAPTARDRFLQILTFATTIHDRVYLINGQFEKFDISVEGEDMVLAHEPKGRGALLLGAHMGSFEVMHSLSRRQQGLSVAMAMYEENARKIGGILAAINPDWVPDIVPLGQINAMLNIAERLDKGAYVGVLADRTLGEEPAQAVQFLGQEAYVPTGPMRAAAILRCPVFCMVGLYRGGNRYHVAFERVADFSATSVGSRELAVRAAIDRYVAVLERHCRSDPYNWFNFFDFWRRPPRTQGH